MATNEENECSPCQLEHIIRFSLHFLAHWKIGSCLFDVFYLVRDDRKGTVSRDSYHD